MGPGENPNGRFQGSLRLTAGMPQPAAVKPVIIMRQLVIETDPVKRRSATAATFAASLELAKAGQIELRQGEVFAPIQIRKKGD